MRLSLSKFSSLVVLTASSAVACGGDSFTGAPALAGAGQGGAGQGGGGIGGALQGGAGQGGAGIGGALQGGAGQGGAGIGGALQGGAGQGGAGIGGALQGGAGQGGAGIGGALQGGAGQGGAGIGGALQGGAAGASGQAGAAGSGGAGVAGQGGNAGASGAAALGFGLVFLTSQTHMGQFPPPEGGSVLDGRAGADEFCRTLADAAESTPVVKGRKWVALLSWRDDGLGDAWQRLPRKEDKTLATAYRLVDQVTPVFAAGADFDGGTPLTPENAISVSEKKEVLGEKTVWTGSTIGSVSSGSTCGGWNFAEPDKAIGRLGNSGSIGSWASDGNKGNAVCATSHRLYCFEADPK